MALGRSTEELLSPDRGGLSWDEFIEWQAYYEIEPWGEDRADGRAAVQIAYLLAPYLPSDTDLPELTWPYFGEAEQPDPDEIKARIEEHTLRWAKWEEERRKKKGLTR